MFNCLIKTDWSITPHYYIRYWSARCSNSAFNLSPVRSFVLAHSHSQSHSLARAHQAIIDGTMPQSISTIWYYPHSRPLSLARTHSLKRQEAANECWNLSSHSSTIFLSIIITSVRDDRHGCRSCNNIVLLFSNSQKDQTQNFFIRSFLIRYFCLFKCIRIYRFFSSFSTMLVPLIKLFQSLSLSLSFFFVLFNQCRSTVCFLFILILSSQQFFTRQLHRGVFF